MLCLGKGYEMARYWKADDDSVIDFEPSGTGWAPCTAKEAKEARQRYAVRKLHEWIQPGQGVHTVLTHVAANGMSRRLKVVIAFGGAPFNITRYVAQATGYSLNDREGSIVVGGCGSDAGFSVVYALGRALWPNGTPEPHGTRNGKPDSDGGYALKHAWL
jgi:hypothetical protein